MPCTKTLRAALLLSAFGLLTLTPAWAQRSQREVRLDPIPMPATAFLEKNYEAQKRAWAERLLLAPARKDWEGKPWAAEAAALVGETFALIEKEYAVGANLGSLAPRFKKLLEVSGDDPLIAWLGAQALKDERQNWRDAQPTLDRVLKTSRTISGALECHAMRVDIALDLLQGYKTVDERRRLFTAATRAINDGSYDAEAETVFVRDQIEFLDLAAADTPEPWLRWQEELRKSQWPEWVKLTLEGHSEKELAWVKRSSGWSEEVSNEQWRGFAEHLKTARDLLAKAHRLRPDRPEPPAAMIAVAMGESVDLTEIRDWFDRSVSAQLDYGPAYHAFLWALRPRWGGSLDLMLAFGEVCAETKRFDTMVPSRLMTACLNVNDEVERPLEIFRHSRVREDIIAISKGYLEVAANAPPQTRSMRMSNAAMCAFLADDDAVAAQALKEAGPKLHPITTNYLDEMLMHEAMMRTEIAADTGAFGEAVRALGDPPKDATPESIEEGLQKIDDKQLSPEALAYIQDRRAIYGFKKALAAGDWVPLKGRAGLTPFIQSGVGTWEAEADGSLVVTGRDLDWSALLWRIPMEDDVEVRADVSFDIPEGEIAANGYGMGTFLRWTTEGRARFMIFHSQSGEEIARIHQNQTDAATKISAKFQPVNQLRSWVIDKKLSFEVNGKKAGQTTQEKLEIYNDSGHVGLVSFKLPWGAKARVSNLAVRKVDSKLLAAEGRKSPVAAEVTAPKRAGEPRAASGNRLYWQIGIFGALVLAALLVHRLVKSREV